MHQSGVANDVKRGEGNWWMVDGSTVAIEAVMVAGTPVDNNPERPSNSLAPTQRL